MDIAGISESLKRFSWPDYLVFILMLIVCSLIGIYFGWQDHVKHKKLRGRKVRRGSEALDYLVGGRKMKVFPVAMSLVARYKVFLKQTLNERVLILNDFQFDQWDWIVGN